VRKVLWIKVGWSEYYRGEPVDGNFGWLIDNRRRRNKKTGHEAFNFMPGPGGQYYVYVPPQSGTSAPYNEDNEGWTVICLAKNPKHPGVHVVGWYENATLLGDWREPPKDRQRRSTGDARPGYDWSYCILSASAYFVPPGHRTMPFSDTSIRQGKYSFLVGPNLKVRSEESERNKQRVLGILDRQLQKLQAVAVHNPDAEKIPDPRLNQADPLVGFGTPQQRKAVELASEKQVISYYKKRGYAHINMTKIVCGYDFLFTKGGDELHVEVKGTAGVEQHFYLTRNEFKNGLQINRKWRLAIVTEALAKKPKVTILEPRQVRKRFDLDPICYEARLIPRVSK
jgi:hypothetical protein